MPLGALLLSDAGRAEQAVELYALALRSPFVAHARWFEDVAGRYIAALAASLSPEVVAAAQKRSQNRNMVAIVAETLTTLEEQEIS